VNGNAINIGHVKELYDTPGDDRRGF